jgi:glyceraldehyde-3-phosphate dehydrogenase (ferredoxin)
LPPAGQLKFQFTADRQVFDIVADSMLNAKYAMAIVDAILFEPRCAVFRDGIRSAAHQLDRQYHINSVDRAVFLAHGETGGLTPNQYWVPGMFSPMAMMGKYYVYYGMEFVPPEVLGKKNVERMTYELFNDNSGICRFHRKWAELITDEILAAHYGLKVDYKAHQFNLAREIHERESEKSVVWESERLADLVYQFLLQIKAGGFQNPVLDDWLERFKADKRLAARDYWEAIYQAIDSAFAAGSQAIPDMLTAAQAKQKAAS